MAQHAGTSLFDAEGNYQGDNPLSVEAMQFVHDLVHEHQIAGIAPADAQNDWFGPAYWAAFKANKFTMLYGPPWHIGGLQINVPEQEGMWAAQRLPTGLGESRPTANFGGTGQCITEQSQHQDIAYDLIAAGNSERRGQPVRLPPAYGLPCLYPDLRAAGAAGALALLRWRQDR